MAAVPIVLPGPPPIGASPEASIERTENTIKLLKTAGDSIVDSFELAIQALQLSWGIQAVTTVNRATSVRDWVLNKTEEEILIDEINRIDARSLSRTKDRCKRCPACSPPVGTICVSQIHWTRPDPQLGRKGHQRPKKTHDTFTNPDGGHFHVLYRRQSPPERGCQCFWMREEFPFSGDIDIYTFVIMVGIGRCKDEWDTTSE